MATQGSLGRSLRSRFVGGLPLVNSVLSRLRIDDLLKQALPSSSRRARIPPTRALGVLLRNLILNQRRPLYTFSDWARLAEPALVGLADGDGEALNDDRLGRALDALFDADRAALMTQIVVRAVREFEIDLSQIHNDSTTLTLQGRYDDADGRTMRGQPTLAVTHGHNKDHRPDLKQLLLVLTISADGAVPIHFRAMDGNTTDDTTHVDTWDAIRRLAGRADFLYVADCKLCTQEAMTHIDGQGGRFVTILPRTRREDRWFREHLLGQTPPWEEIARRENPRRKSGTRDVWKVVESPLPSKEGYRIVWVWNSLKMERDAATRQEAIEKAWIELEQLQTKLQSPRSRMREPAKVAVAVERILAHRQARRFLTATVEEKEDPVYRQEKRGRPGEKTRYVRKKRRRFSIATRLNQEAIDADAKSDGMFPLITNVQDLPASKILEAYKFQPKLEKRHEQWKSVEGVAPVWLKSVVRVEAMLFLYFIALMVQSLLERDVRRNMKKEAIGALQLYPEERGCEAPTTERILDLFEPLQRHRLYENERLRETFEPELSEIQRQILRLLRVPPAAFESVV